MHQDTAERRRLTTSSAAASHRSSTSSRLQRKPIGNYDAAAADESSGTMSYDVARQDVGAVAHPGTPVQWTIHGMPAAVRFIREPGGNVCKTGGNVD